LEKPKPGPSGLAKPERKVRRKRKKSKNPLIH